MQREEEEQIHVQGEEEKEILGCDERSALSVSSGLTLMLCETLIAAVAEKAQMVLESTSCTNQLQSLVVSSARSELAVNLFPLFTRFVLAFQTKHSPTAVLHLHPIHNKGFTV